jgi:hypothetical protein
VRLDPLIAGVRGKVAFDPKALTAGGNIALLWLRSRPTTKRIEDGDPGTLEIRYVARYYGEPVFERRGRDHEIGAVIADCGTQDAPTPRSSQVEWHDPLAVEG